MELSGGGDLRYHMFKNKRFNEKEASKEIKLSFEFKNIYYKKFRILGIMFDSCT